MGTIDTTKASQLTETEKELRDSFDFMHMVDDTNKFIKLRNFKTIQHMEIRNEHSGYKFYLCPKPEDMETPLFESELIEVRDFVNAFNYPFIPLRLRPYSPDEPDCVY